MIGIWAMVICLHEEITSKDFLLRFRVGSWGTAKHHFFAAGKHGQYIYIVPEQNLIFVRFGRTDPFRHWVDVFEILAERMAGLNP